MNAKKEKEPWPHVAPSPGSECPGPGRAICTHAPDEEGGVLNFFNIPPEIVSEAPKSEPRLSFETKNQFDLFYQIKNLNSFYKTARSYMLDHERGVRSFALISEYDGPRPEMNSLALASFFQSKKEAMTVFIIAPRSVLESYESERRSEKVGQAGDSVDFNFYQYSSQVSALAIEDLLLASEKVDDFKVMLEILREVLDAYEVSFWSLPSYLQLKEMKKFIFVLTYFVQNVSIVIKRGKTTHKGLRHLKGFFQNYNIPIKGVLVEGS